MKKISRFFVLPLLCFVLLFSVASCGKNEFNDACDHIKTHLKDPDSLRIESADGYEYVDEDGNKIVTFFIVYNAKNSFGGYGDSDYMYLYSQNGSKWKCSECDDKATMKYLAVIYDEQIKESAKKIYTHNEQ